MATVTGRLTYACVDINEYNKVLDDVQNGPNKGKFSNIVFDQNALTIAFDLTDTE